MMPTIAISDQVNVTVSVGTPGLSAQAFGTTLITGLSARLPATDRIRFYSSLSAVAADFQTSDEEYKAAQVWFAAQGVPQLAIARRWTSAVSGGLYGALLTSAQQALALFTAVTNGGFDVSLNGVNKQLTALDFHLQTTLNGVASVIQTALAVALAGTTCVWTGSRFVIQTALTGTGSSVGFAVAPTGAGSPVDISALLGLAASSGGYSSTGAAAEATADVSLANIAGKSSQWYGNALSHDSSASDKLAAAQWSINNNKAYLHTETAAGAIAAGDTTSTAYLIAQLTVVSAVVINNGQAVCIYSSTSNYAAVGAWVNLAKIDFTQADAMQTMNGQQIAGVTPESIDATAAAYLRAKNCGAYANYGAVGASYPMIFDGKASSGRWADEVLGLAWLQNQLQVDIFNYLRSLRSRLPQTDEGMASLMGIVEKTCQKAVNNGLLAPGVWLGNQIKTTAGDVVNNGDLLKVGFRVMADSIASQSAASRATRVAPPIAIAAKGAGAIHQVNVAVTFDR
jgi:hypothetical protein